MIAIRRDALSSSTTLYFPGEDVSNCGTVSVFAPLEINYATLFVSSTSEVRPFASDSHLNLICRHEVYTG